MMKTVFLLAFFIAALGISVPAHAQMTRQQIIGKIERDFGVEVLKVQSAKDMGPNVLAVTVMNPPGNFNEAFQVNTIAVNALTGTLVLVEVQTPQGHRFSAPPVTVRTSPKTAKTS